ncbi:hypothetical protein Desdi_2851 [Desulfitobacterium dichloroeliminans LMG P-21439]|uniref:Uncharacterized protein n=2 Tax=Desulfitobacterium dichloroeliminans TaxID=233055 RepID=L0FBD9_DESDL|nr:hypothetical protein Desdi_2851 [Desulfitobacterium dichloroeliminans LMG P-21439]
MDKLRIWAWYLAIGCSVILALVSFLVDESFLRVILNAIVGFALIYGICIVSIAIFEKSAIDQETEYLGAVFDIAVGQEDDLNNAEIERDSATEQTPATIQAPSAVAGQLNHELVEGLPNAEKQAEIVRRMGWGD